jgi:hypothetical protein
MPIKSTIHCMAELGVNVNKRKCVYCTIDTTNGMDCTFDDVLLVCPDYTADICRFQIVSRNSDGHVTICIFENSLYSRLTVAHRYYTVRSESRCALIQTRS